MMISLLQKLKRDESGYTIMEMMVVVLILGILLGAFYAFLFGGERAAREGRGWLEMNQTARLGMERLSRELREADQILSVDGSRKITFQADFDASGTFVDGVYQPDISPDEKVTYEYLSGDSTITVVSEEPPAAPAILASNITAFSFRYYGSDPRLDCAVGDPPTFTGTCTPDGIVTWQEIDRSPTYGLFGYGDDNGLLDFERPYVSSVVIQFSLTVGARTHSYRSAVELRNSFK